MRGEAWAAVVASVRWRRCRLPMTAMNHAFISYRRLKHPAWAAGQSRMLSTTARRFMEFDLDAYESLLLENEASSTVIDTASSTADTDATLSSADLRSHMITSLLEALPPRGFALLTALSLSADMEALERLPSSPSLLAFLQANPQHFVTQRNEANRWQVRRARQTLTAAEEEDSMLSSRRRDGRQQRLPGKEEEGSACVELDDPSRWYLEEELGAILNANRLSSAPSAASTAPSQRRTATVRLQSVVQSSNCECHADGTSDALLERMAAVVAPAEVISSLQLRERLEAQDSEVIEWVRQHGGMRRYLWQQRAVARKWLDYDACSTAGWVARAGGLLGRQPWTRPSSASSAAAAAAAAGRADGFADEWSVDLQLDASEEELLQMENVDGSAPEDSSEEDGKPPPTKKNEKVELSPEALLEAHTRLAEAHGWRTPADVLPFLVETVPTFPVPINALLLSDALVRLFGLKVTMPKLVRLYRYYFLIHQPSSANPQVSPANAGDDSITVQLHPERVVSTHPNAGAADRHYDAYRPKEDCAAETLKVSNSGSAFCSLRRTIRSQLLLTSEGMAQGEAKKMKAAQRSQASCEVNARRPPRHATAVQSTSPRPTDDFLAAIQSFHSDSPSLSPAQHLLAMTILTVPYDTAIPLEQAAARCNSTTEALEDLLDPSQCCQHRYAAFNLYTEAGGRRMVRLRPLWVSPHSTGEVPAEDRLPASFLRRLLPTWRPIAKVLQGIPKEEHDALQAAARHCGSVAAFLRLFGTSSCWVEPSHLQSDDAVRVRRYCGQLAMDELEPACLRALHCAVPVATRNISTQPNTMALLPDVVTAVKAAEERKRKEWHLESFGGTGFGSMLSQCNTLPASVSAHPTMFIVKIEGEQCWLQRRSIFTVQGSTTPAG